MAEKDAFFAKLKALIEMLEGQVQDCRPTKFGPKSEKLGPAQLELTLEDLETAIAETQAQIAAVEDRIAASEQDRTPLKAPALPESLPRVEGVLESAPAAAATWSGSAKTGPNGWMPSGTLSGDRYGPPQMLGP